MFSYRCCRPGAGIGAEREFGPKNRSFKRNARFLGLIRLEFGVEDGRIGVIQGTLAGMQPDNKPKLLDQLRTVIRIKRYSSPTEPGYVDRTTRFHLEHGRR